MNSRFSDLAGLPKLSPHGPGRKFGPFHYYKALSVLSEKGRTGRARLSSELGIGEGSIRTLLDELEDAGFIRRNNSGIVLTRKAQKTLSSFPVNTCPVKRCGLSLGSFTTAALARKAAPKITNGILQRDEAVRHGAAGAVTLLIMKGKLLIPPMMEPVTDAEAESAVFGRLLGSEEDAVILTSADSPEISEQAAFFAALTVV
ncbi:MAG: DUF4443 domain-containing protein [Candidatus Thermoplasmatota archaeon]|nr:DUF4443 domain-containing protein [Candidatus Sysuiplasma jiujiangense]MCL4317997.1 DUF4443 domain-containing protein [Candidatus Thermoplasmatota archaeon]MCL5253076.1 DUF4443 domain-containing protein [Candidatus Thermoplasmatota archaeon]